MEGDSSRKRKQVEAGQIQSKKPHNEPKYSRPEEAEDEQLNELMEDSEVGNEGEKLDASTSGNSSMDIRGRHKHCVTAIVLESNERYFISSSKDGYIIKWDFKIYKKLDVVKYSKLPDDIGHNSTVLSLALSDDDKYLASGDSKNFIKIWTPENLCLLKTFSHSLGEKAGINGLLFRKGTHHLISSSRHKTIKVWTIDEERDEIGRYKVPFEASDLSTYGDQSIILGCGHEGVIRLIDLEEKTTKEFKVEGRSIDCLAMLDLGRILFTTMEGFLVLWSMELNEVTSETKARDVIEHHPDFISALCVSKKKTIATGSNDGYIRLWNIVDDKIMPVSNIPVPGIINAFRFSADDSYLLASSGRENRKGRWLVMKDVKNMIYKINLKSYDM